MRGFWLMAALLVAPPALAMDGAKLTAAMEAEEAALPAHMGAAVLDGGTGRLWGYHQDDLFPLMSTHKAFACAALLARVDRGEASLAAPVSIAPSDLVTYSPITQKLVAPQAPTLADMCAAALAVSDNTAANMVLKALGGPDGVTRFFRALGDPVSRLDRFETALNEALPGDARDTTTPALAARDLNHILNGDALSPPSRLQLTAWMESDRVAGALLRAALPPDWRIADKTGAGERGSRGVVALITPPGRAPLAVAIYMRDTGAAMDARNAAIARIGAALVESEGR